MNIHSRQLISDHDCYDHDFTSTIRECSIPFSNKSFGESSMGTEHIIFEWETK